MSQPPNEFEQVLQRVSKLVGKRLFFIVGCQRSGTTWLQRLIDGHPDVCCRGEGFLSSRLLPALNEALEKFNDKVWAGQDAQFTEDQFRYVFAFAVWLLMDNRVGDASVQCVGDKTPEHAIAMDYLDRAFPGCRFVHIIRDGRDATTSAWFKFPGSWHGDFHQQFPDLQSFTEYMVTEHWLPYITAARAFADKHPDRYMEVRFEDLHTDADPQIKRICEFLEVDSSAASIEACKIAGEFRELSEGRDRGDEQPDAFFRKGVVGDWKNHFDKRSLATFMHFGGDLLRDLGYE